MFYTSSLSECKYNVTIKPSSFDFLAFSFWSRHLSYIGLVRIIQFELVTIWFWLYNLKYVSIETTYFSWLCFCIVFSYGCSHWWSASFAPTLNLLLCYWLSPLMFWMITTMLNPPSLVDIPSDDAKVDDVPPLVFTYTWCLLQLLSLYLFILIIINNLPLKESLHHKTSCWSEFEKKQGS